MIDFQIEQRGDALRLFGESGCTDLKRTIWQFSVHAEPGRVRQVEVRHESTTWEERETRRHKWTVVRGWWWNSNFQMRGRSSDFYVPQPDADPKIIEFVLAYVRAMVVYKQPEKPKARTGQGH